MSYRRSLSFKTKESNLVKIFDDNGGSDFVKKCMYFYLEYKDKLIIGVKSDNYNDIKKEPNVVKQKVSKWIK